MMLMDLEQWEKQEQVQVNILEFRTQIDIYFATFAKSMAGIGGFVASTKEVINYLRYNLRSQIYAKSLPMAMTIGAIKRLELIQAHPEIQRKAMDNCQSTAERFKRGRS